MSEVSTEIAETAETAEAAPARDRGVSLLETRNRKMAELFEGKHYKVDREVHLEKGQVFKTPFGHKGRHGFVLVEVTEHGHVAAPEHKFIIGALVLKVAHEDYSAIYGGLPENFGKSARQIKAEAAAAAKADAPAVSEPVLIEV